jgi:hypothetical protein
MVLSISLCLESLGAPAAEARFLSCVALATGAPGLGLASDGSVCWQRADAAAAIEVAGDGRLMLRRIAASGPFAHVRAGRTHEPGAGTSTVLLDGDELELGGRRLRVHVHGAATSASPPFPVASATPAPEIPELEVRHASPAPPVMEPPSLVREAPPPAVLGRGPRRRGVLLLAIAISVAVAVVAIVLLLRR